ncbi:MAG: Bifunctional phosphoglucose/phosphomannose isomerase [Candidatus Peribacteria bacterium GW2011_GWB1_54_5]|nr:MAG: Bifunctional phosphoglucose/phosphomannose isomerase [Candidatus Peribacteria bacterium GW2011_GWB1_54_5]
MLDDLKKISDLDRGHILAAIERLPGQIRQAWNEVKLVDIPQAYFEAKNVVVSGMGGSGLGARVVRYLMFDRLRVPIEYVNQYLVPNYVNDTTLVIISSYSGNTEETIASTYSALKKNARVVGMTTGGKLGELFKKENLPCWLFEPRENPSGQPRMGLGYSIAGTLAILAKCQFLSLEENEIKELIESSEGFVKEFGVRVATKENLAKKLALNYASKIPILFSAEHLVGVSHAFRNQINENSKTFSGNYKISEANHHLMEGLKFPAKAKDVVRFLIFESPLYYEKIQKRFGITEDILAKNGYGFDVYKTTAKNKLSEAFEVLILGSYISFYLAILHGIDPSPIPWVDYFKEKMDN